MAYESTQTDPTQIDPTRQIAPDEVLIVPPDRQLPSGRDQSRSGLGEVLRMYGQLAAQAFDFARQSAVCATYRVRESTNRTSSRAAYNAQEIAKRTRSRASEFQREQPVRALALVAGAAFLAGIGTRIWRSRSI